MAKAVNVYVKRQLRLDLLTVPQREMYHLGQVAKDAIIKRVKQARGPDDRPAAPLKSESWKRIKKAKGLRPIRDLQGTGMMWPEQGKKRRKTPKRVGHLLEQITTRKVTENKAVIPEPSTRAGRMKARTNRDMLMFSPGNEATVIRAANQILITMKNSLVKTKMLRHS